MSPRKKATSTQDKLEESLKKATTKKQKQKKSEETVKEYKAPNFSHTKEEDDEWLEKLETKYKGVWNSNAQTITLTLPQFGFLLEMARR